MTVLLTLAASSNLGAQEPTLPRSDEARLEDFGLVDLASVVRGRVSLVHDPAGDRLALHYLRDVPGGAPPAVGSGPDMPGWSGSDDTPELKALWVWNTEELIRDVQQRGSFLDFVEEQAIQRVFMYVPAAEGRRPAGGFVPFDGDALAPLLAELRARGALTYALDGDPDYAHPENHEGVLATVRRVADHNRTHPPEERFYGVRYDIEPYLVRGFQGPRRQEILSGYVTLLASIAEVAHEGGLVAGADIPFWFDAGDEETGEPFEAVLDGDRRLVLEHIMSVMDDVAIMAYRTNAEGPDGVLTHSWGELSMQEGREVGVFVGVETTRLYDEELFTFRGPGRVGLPTLADAAWVVIEDRGGGAVRAWLIDGAEALAELGRQAPDPERLRYWFAGQPVGLDGDRLSFHDLGPEAMQAVTGEVVRSFRTHEAFLGLAYHDYLGLKSLLER